MGRNLRIGSESQAGPAAISPIVGSSVSQAIVASSSRSSRIRTPEIAGALQSMRADADTVAAPPAAPSSASAYATVRASPSWTARPPSDSSRAMSPVKTPLPGAVSPRTTATSGLVVLDARASTVPAQRRSRSSILLWARSPQR
jgi:hypothetical protein